MNPEELSAYLDGELGPSRAEAIRANPGLRSELERLRVAGDRLRVHCPPDPGFLVRHRQRRREVSPLARWTFRELGFRLAAATVLVAGFAALQARPEPPLAAFESEAFGPPELPATEPVLHIAIGPTPGALDGGR